MSPESDPPKPPVPDDYDLGAPARELVHLEAEPSTNFVPISNAFLDGWNDFRRGQDYYEEGALIWLRADTIIREQTGGQKSLDDFLRSFLGQRDTEPVVVPYTREDVEAALSAICPFNWHQFFETRIYQVNPKPPIEGSRLQGGG